MDSGNLFCSLAAYLLHATAGLILRVTLLCLCVALLCFCVHNTNQNHHVWWLIPGWSCVTGACCSGARTHQHTASAQPGCQVFVSPFESVLIPAFDLPLTGPQSIPQSRVGSCMRKGKAKGEGPLGSQTGSCTGCVCAWKGNRPAATHGSAVPAGTRHVEPGLHACCRCMRLPCACCCAAMHCMQLGRIYALICLRLFSGVTRAALHALAGSCLCCSACQSCTTSKLWRLARLSVLCRMLSAAVTRGMDDSHI